MQQGKTFSGVQLYLTCQLFEIHLFGMLLYLQKIKVQNDIASILYVFYAAAFVRFSVVLTLSKHNF